jgi:hypothetical protein
MFMPCMHASRLLCCLHTAVKMPWMLLVLLVLLPQASRAALAHTPWTPPTTLVTPAHCTPPALVVQRCW